MALAAPGGDTRSSASNGILSTLNAGLTTPGADSYAYYQGTSMASPHVAAVVALMIAKNPALTPDQVTAALKSAARAFPGSCGGCGAGIVDAHAAVLAAIGGGGVGSNETEPNNSLSTANYFAAATLIQGSMASSSDDDNFSIDLPPGKTLTAT